MYTKDWFVMSIQSSNKIKMTAWDLFVLRHQNLGNLILHALSFVMFCFSPIIALFTWNSWWLAGFFASGLVGTVGHFIFKDGGVSIKESTHDPKVPLFVARMFLMIFKQTYRTETLEIKKKFADYCIQNQKQIP